MKCDLLKYGNICENFICDCGRQTRANLFFSQYPDAPHRNGIPLAFPCTFDIMICNGHDDWKPAWDDPHCKSCLLRYWNAKICNK